MGTGVENPIQRSGGTGYYINDPRRTNVRREQAADSIERHIKDTCKLEPISLEDYNRKVKRLRTITSRSHGQTDKDDDESTGTPHVPSRHLDASESSFLNRVITYFGESKAALESDPSNVARYVEEFIQEVMKAVAYKDQRFVGKLVACGSYYEGVKVKTPNEFDYLWELKRDSLNSEDLEFIHIKPDTFKPRKNPDIYGRSYYKLEFKNHVPKLWKCLGCKTKGKAIACTHKAISPRSLQEHFRDTVHAVASHLVPQWKDAQVTSSGPAVTLFTQLNTKGAAEMLTSYGKKKLKRNNDVEFYLIKIDLTLAIPVEKNDPCLTWPLEGFGDAELDQVLTKNMHIDKCHLVTAGDFWRVSFSSWETQLVHELTAGKSNKKSCFQALKYMRDQLALTEDHEASLLGTYPLKVTFLKENHGLKDEEDWDFNQLAGKTSRILHNVEMGGSEGRLTSYFIKNDPVLLESDRSYLESRRIKQYLEKMAHHYRVNGYVHLGILAVFIICHIVMCVVAGLHLMQYQDDDGTACLKDNDPIIFEVSAFLFSIIPLTVICTILAVVGFLWIVIQRWCLKSSNVLYQMFKGPLYFYVVFLVVSTTQMCMAIRLGVGFSKFFPDCQNTSVVVKNLSQTILFFSALILLICIIHSCIFILKNCRNLKFFSWEIIFCDQVYRELWQKCCCVTGTTTPDNKPKPSFVGLVNPLFEPPLEDVYEDVQNHVGYGREVLRPEHTSIPDTSTSSNTQAKQVHISPDHSTVQRSTKLAAATRSPDIEKPAKPMPAPRVRKDQEPPPLPPRRSTSEASGPEYDLRFENQLYGDST